jgi:hypothetical protein
MRKSFELGFCAALIAVACSNSSGGSPAGGPVTLASLTGSSSASDIALDATHVYLTSTSVSGCPRTWMVCDRSTIVKVPLDGGAPVSLATGYGAEGIAVDATSVYWANSVSISVSGPGMACAPDAGPCDLPPVLGADVMRAPLDGGTDTTVAQEGSYAVAVSATSIYWTSSACPQGAGACSGVVRAAPVGGGAPMTLASLPGHTVDRLAIDATGAYFTSDGAVMKVPIAGGTPAMIASGPASGIAIDSRNLYWTSECASATPFPQCVASLMKMPLGGGDATALASWHSVPYQSGSGTPHPIAVDADHVYWTRFACDDGGCRSALLQVAIAGGSPTVLDDGGTITQTTPGVVPLAVDGTNLYWASPFCPKGGPCVMKLSTK